MGNICNNCEGIKSTQEKQYQKNLIRANQNNISRNDNKIINNKNKVFFPSDDLSFYSNCSSLKKNNKDKFLKRNNSQYKINNSSFNSSRSSLSNINNNIDYINHIDNGQEIHSLTKISKLIKGYLYRIKFNNIIKIYLIKEQNKLIDDITNYINVNNHINKYFFLKNIFFINNKNLKDLNIFHLLYYLKNFLYKNFEVRNNNITLTNPNSKKNHIKIIYDKKYYFNKSKYIYQNNYKNKTYNMVKIYYGQFKDDKFIEGILINLINKIILIANFDKKEIINGKGIKLDYNQSYRNNRIYLYYGQLNESIINGFGRIIYLNSMERYKGNFIKEKFHGEGHFYCKNGDQYKGIFNFGEITGYGILFKKNGEKYEGKFVNGLLHGNGKIIMRDGRTYACEFENGKIKGQGYYIQDEGSLLSIK